MNSPVERSVDEVMDEITSRCEEIELKHELVLRELLWLLHNPEHRLIFYADIGGLRCGECGIDFLEMPVKEIEMRLDPTGELQKYHKRAEQKYKEQTQAFNAITGNLKAKKAA